jgi:hypothetical protein
MGNLDEIDPPLLKIHFATEIHPSWNLIVTFHFIICLQFFVTPP